MPETLKKISKSGSNKKESYYDPPYNIKYCANGLWKNNNSKEEINITSNGQFYFENPVNIGDSYLVTAKDSKSSTGQICSASNNKGVVKGNVENIQITCSSIVRTISGNINNLSGTLILQNNFGGDQIQQKHSCTSRFRLPIVHSQVGMR